MAPVLFKLVQVYGATFIHKIYYIETVPVICYKFSVFISVADLGSRIRMFSHPGPNFFYSGSRIRIRNTGFYVLEPVRSVSRNIYAKSVFRIRTPIDLALLDPDPDSEAKQMTKANN